MHRSGLSILAQAALPKPASPPALAPALPVRVGPRRPGRRAACLCAAIWGRGGAVLPLSPFGLAQCRRHD